METIASIGTGPINRLLARLPSALDIEATARQYGAFSRSRRITSGTALLHLALAYGMGELSLRDTAAWATLKGAPMSDVAVLERLRLPAVATWLGVMLEAVLATRRDEAERATAGWRVRIIDATTVSGPGKAAGWRLHAGYDLTDQRLTAIEIGDGKASESLGRFTIGPGEIALADRAYLKARDLRAVGEAGGDFIVRAGWNAVRWRTLDGEPFDLFAMLDRLAWGEHAETAIMIWPERTARDAFAARLVIRRLDKAAAEASRARARQAARKEQRRIQPQTLKAAEFVLLVTSLEAHDFTATDILALYRRRWQVELAFKRMKSLFGLDELPAKDPDLARTWLYAKLIANLLAEDMTREILDSPPSARRRPAGPFLLDLAHPENARADHLCRHHRKHHRANMARAKR
jgi:DDE family transposase